MLTLASLTVFFEDALRIVNGCLRPTLTDYLQVLTRIQPAELCRKEEILPF